MNTPTVIPDFSKRISDAQRKSDGLAYRIVGWAAAAHNNGGDLGEGFGDLLAEFRAAEAEWRQAIADMHAAVVRK